MKLIIHQKIKVCEVVSFIKYNANSQNGIGSFFGLCLDRGLNTFHFEYCTRGETLHFMINENDTYFQKKKKKKESIMLLICYSCRKNIISH
jgi:hypothetical protein